MCAHTSKPPTLIEAVHLPAGQDGWSFYIRNWVTAQGFLSWIWAEFAHDLLKGGLLSWMAEKKTSRSVFHFHLREMWNIFAEWCERPRTRDWCVPGVSHTVKRINMKGTVIVSQCARMTCGYHEDDFCRSIVWWMYCWVCSTSGCSGFSCGLSQCSKCFFRISSEISEWLRALHWTYGLLF